MSSYGDVIPPLDAETPPPRPTTPAVRWSFVLALLFLLICALLVYGVPYAAFRAGYSFESGRARAATESLAKLDNAGIINRASELFRQAAAATSPSVVSIQCLRDTSNMQELHRLPPNARPRGLTFSSFGSGVVIDKEQGYIVTNGHVVDGADEIQVRVGRGQDLIARLVGADAKTDLAVLQVKGPLESQAEWADMQQVDVGDWVLAIGSPFMLEHSVSAGIVSAVGRRNLPIIGESSGYQDFVQTDAAINPGNSGGPLVDLRGRIVGINTAIYNPREGVNPEGTAGNVGIGFALSASLAKNVVEQLIRDGRVVRGYMGVILDNVDQTRAQRLGLPNARGAFVVDVDPDSPAAVGGLKPGDVVVGLGDQEIADLADLRNRTGLLPVGSNINISYYRDGKKSTAQLEIAALPLLRSLGLRLGNDPPEAQRQEPGVSVANVDLASPAFRAGLRPRQRLIAVGSRTVNSRSEAEAVAERFDPAKGISLEIIEPNGEQKQLLMGVRRR